LQKLGLNVGNDVFFDTVRVDVGPNKASDAVQHLLKKGVNVRKLNDNVVTISLDETVTEGDISLLLGGFADAAGKKLAFTPASLAKEVPAQKLGSFARSRYFLIEIAFAQPKPTHDA
jgi:glycine dehydrogenase